MVIFAFFRLTGGFLQVFAPSYELLAVARFLIGTGVMGTYISTYVLSKRFQNICHGLHNIYTTSYHQLQINQ